MIFTGFILADTTKASDHLLTPDEQYNLGMKYAAGYVKKQDLTKAFQLYRQAARQDHKLAMTNLAHHYYLGAGTKKNLKKAFDWFTKSCDLKEPLACKALGAMYATGQYIEKNNAEAIVKYRVSVESGDPEAMLSLADILLTNGEPTPNDQQEAIELINRSARLAHPPAIYRVGLMYYYGKLINRDLVTAFAWIDIASMMQEESAIKAKVIVKGYLSREQLRRSLEVSKELRQLHFADKFREL